MTRRAFVPVLWLLARNPNFEVVFEMRSGIFEVSVVVSIDPNMVPIS